MTAPPSDYFEILGLTEKLRLDAKDLQARFYNYSRQYHPDRFARAPAEQQAHALEASSILNDAFRTLRDPVTRAEYVMRRHGLDIGEQRTKDVPPELLEEVFELNMALEELKAGDQDARRPVTEALDKFSAMRAALRSVSIRSENANAPIVKIARTTRTNTNTIPRSRAGNRLARRVLRLKVMRQDVD